MCCYRWLVKARSPVHSTLELHRNTILTVFSCDVVVVVVVGGGLVGVSERGGVMLVQGSHSLGKKAVEQSGGAGSDTPVSST